MAFEAARIGEALWPEGAGVLTVCGAEVLGAALDTALAREQPVCQYIVTGGAVVGGMLGTAYGARRDFAKGVLYGGLVLVTANLCRMIYDAVTGKPISVKQVFALIPETKRKAKPPAAEEGLEKRFIALETTVRRLAEGKGAETIAFNVEPKVREMVPVR